MRKNRFPLTRVLFPCFVLSLSVALSAEEMAADAVKPKSAGSKAQTVIADFDSGDKPNNLGQDFGTWSNDSNDATQGSRLEFVADVSTPSAGYCIRLSYDVESANPAFNGFWMKLGGLDAKMNKTLYLSVKGDDGAKFTSRFKLELKNDKGESGSTYLEGISQEWQTFDIPLKKFEGLNDLSSLTELVIVFEDAAVTEKNGAVLIDGIRLGAKKKAAKTVSK